jgi:hypothetical protein
MRNVADTLFVKSEHDERVQNGLSPCPANRRCPICERASLARKAGR